MDGWIPANIILSWKRDILKGVADQLLGKSKINGLAHWTFRFTLFPPSTHFPIPPGPKVGRWVLFPFAASRLCLAVRNIFDLLKWAIHPKDPSQFTCNPLGRAREKEVEEGRKERRKQDEVGKSSFDQ
jgi:hypothetical protein